MIEGLTEFFGLALPWLLLAGMLIGLFGLIIPIFPGNVVIFAGVLVFGLIDGFDSRAWVFFVPIALLTLVAVSVDNLLMGAKAKQAGAAWSSLGITLLAAFVVSLLLTPIAGLLAAPLALFLAELARLKGDRRRAWEITSGLLIGWGWAFVIRFALGMLVIGLYLWWALGGG
jgi:uncharacterized protein YqgC (DUF456 family)